MAFEFLLNGVLYQVQTHVGDGQSVVAVQESSEQEQEQSEEVEA